MYTCQPGVSLWPTGKDNRTLRIQKRLYSFQLPPTAPAVPAVCQRSILCMEGKLLLETGPFSSRP